MDPKELDTIIDTLNRNWPIAGLKLRAFKEEYAKVVQERDEAVKNQYLDVCPSCGTEYTARKHEPDKLITKEDND